jgi:threonyl-tRNA synthetase
MTSHTFYDDLFKTSGHWDHYRDDIFHFPPLNEKVCECAEVCHRNEATGALSGLIRVPCFVQSDAHRDQIGDEITNELNFVGEMLEQ